MAVPTTEFTPRQTSIPGLIIFNVTSIGDERGWFQEKFHQAKLVAAGLPGNFLVVQTNVSYNKEPGVSRGMHAEPWDKYVSVVQGKAFVAYVDLRKGDSFGKVESLEIDNNKAVFVPAGVANSYQTLLEDTIYIYSVNDHWSADKYDLYVNVNMADPALAISWPIDINQATVSDRDRNHPMLKDVIPVEF